jgi:hypothetical protein
LDWSIKVTNAVGSCRTRLDSFEFGFASSDERKCAREVPPQVWTYEALYYPFTSSQAEWALVVASTIITRFSKKMYRSTLLYS